MTTYVSRASSLWDEYVGHFPAAMWYSCVPIADPRGVEGMAEKFDAGLARMFYLPIRVALHGLLEAYGLEASVWPLVCVSQSHTCWSWLLHLFSVGMRNGRVYESQDEWR